MAQQSVRLLVWMVATTGSPAQKWIWVWLNWRGRLRKHTILQTFHQTKTNSLYFEWVYFLKVMNSTTYISLSVYYKTIKFNVGPKCNNYSGFVQTSNFLYNQENLWFTLSIFNQGKVCVQIFFLFGPYAWITLTIKPITKFDLGCSFHFQLLVVE